MSAGTEASAARPRWQLSPHSRLLAVGLVIALALGLRLLFMAATPIERFEGDAADYDRHARSIASGHGYPSAAAPGRPTAYRPPAYPYFLAGAYELTGVEHAAAVTRIRVARIAQALLGTLAVALTGLLAARLWERRAALATLVVGALYLPIVLVGGAVVAEPLFVVLTLAALIAAIEQRRSPHGYRWAAIAGVLAGLASLSRSNGIVLVAPLMLAIWGGPPRLSLRAAAPAAVLAAAAFLTISPWTVRNAVVLHSFVPVTTQTGAALAGTYNDVSRNDPQNPGAWRVLRVVPDYAHIYRRKSETPEADLDRRLREAALRYAADHPLYVAEVGFRNTLRMFELAGLRRSRSTAEAIGIDRGWADAGVVCFWITGALALLGAIVAPGRAAAWPLWAVAGVLLLSVIFLNVETPRFRAPLEPFVVILAALALTAALNRVRGRARHRLR